MSKSRRKHSRDFKIRAVELSYGEGSIVDLAAELGVRPELIYRWRSEFSATGEKSFPGNGKKPELSEQESEVARLKRELADVKMERDILKKAIGIFSRKDGRSSFS